MWMQALAAAEEIEGTVTTSVAREQGGENGEKDSGNVESLESGMTGWDAAASIANEITT